MKFSIRELLLVTVIVALAVGWLIHCRKMNDEYREMALENEYLRDELLEERFPPVEPTVAPEVKGIGESHTLEWIPRTTH